MLWEQTSLRSQQSEKKKKTERNGALFTKCNEHKREKQRRGRLAELTMPERNSFNTKKKKKEVEREVEETQK